MKIRMKFQTQENLVKNKNEIPYKFYLKIDIKSVHNSGIDTLKPKGSFRSNSTLSNLSVNVEELIAQGIHGEKKKNS